MEGVAWTPWSPSGPATETSCNVPTFNSAVIYVFGVCDQIGLNPACTATQSNYNIETPHVASALYRQQIKKTLTRLCGCTGWSAPFCLHASKLQTHIVLLHFIFRPHHSVIQWISHGRHVVGWTFPTRSRGNLQTRHRRKSVFRRTSAVPQDRRGASIPNIWSCAG